MECLAFFCGAFCVGLAWMLCARFGGRAWIAKALIHSMGDSEKHEVYLYVQGLVKRNDWYDDDDDGQSSHWTMVSQPSPVKSSHNTNGYFLSLQSGRSQRVTGEPKDCPHFHKTRKGSNHFQKRVRCKDCGKLLSVEPTAAAHKNGSAGQKPSWSKMKWSMLLSLRYTTVWYDWFAWKKSHLGPGLFLEQKMLKLKAFTSWIYTKKSCPPTSRRPFVEIAGCSETRLFPQSKSIA